MTQNAVAEKPLTIPAEGLTVRVGDAEVRAFYVNAAGYKVQVRINGAHRPELGGLYTFDTDAVSAFNALVAHLETPAGVAPVVKLGAVAKGTATKVSDPGHTALAIAHLNGRVERGGKPGQYNVRVLTALAKRGLLKLTYEEGRSDARKVVTGGVLTGAGRVRLDQLTQDEREAAEYAAHAAVINSITVSCAA